MYFKRYKNQPLINLDLITKISREGKKIFFEDDITRYSWELESEKDSKVIYERLIEEIIEPWQ